jgi:hypothetical protein
MMALSGGGELEFPESVIPANEKIRAEHIVGVYGTKELFVISPLSSLLICHGEPQWL